MRKVFSENAKFTKVVSFVNEYWKCIFYRAIPHNETGFAPKRPPYRYVCEICGESRSTKDMLANHIARDHTENPVKEKCPVCSKEFYAGYIKVKMGSKYIL